MNAPWLVGKGKPLFIKLDAVIGPMEVVKSYASKAPATMSSMSRPRLATPNPAAAFGKGGVLKQALFLHESALTPEIAAEPTPETWTEKVDKGSRKKFGGC
jgi:hypothetical protein